MKIQCPNCGGKNFYITEHNGLGYCFNCAYTERSSETREIIKPSQNIPTFREIYTELTSYYHSCVDTHARAYLHARGITDSMIDTFKIGYCPLSSHTLYMHPLSTEAGIAIDNKPVLSDRIVFPYWMADKVCDIRGRAINESKYKYLSLHKRGIYRGAILGFNATPVTDVDIITEGEIKAIVGSLSGYTIRALPGIRSPRRTSIFTSNKQIICFDNQKSNRYDIYNAIHKLAERLPNPFVATLPLRGKDKQDIDSYILSYGIESFQSVIKGAISYNKWKEYK